MGALGQTFEGSTSSEVKRECHDHGRPQVSMLELIMYLTRPQVKLLELTTYVKRLQVSMLELVPYVKRNHCTALWAVQHPPHDSNQFVSVC